MKKTAAVMMIDGFEESETVQIIDLLRRGGVDAYSCRFQDDEYVTGMQGLVVRSDRRFSEDVKEADVIVVPGGRTVHRR